MTVVTMEGVGACCWVCRSLARAEEMDWPLQAGAESTQLQIEASGVLEVTATGGALRVHKELDLGLGMGLDCGKSMGENDLHPPLSPVQPSSTDTIGHNFINV